MSVALPAPVRRLLQWWYDPARRARGLLHDARTVIDSATAGTDSTGRARLEDLLRQRRAEIDDIAALSPQAAKRLHARYQALHREAQGRGDGDELTVLTLALIDLKARRLGAHGERVLALVAGAFAGTEPV